MSARDSYPLNAKDTAAVGVTPTGGTITVEKMRVIDGGVSIIHLSRDEALNLFAALGAILGRDSVGNFVPVWEREGAAK